MKAYPNEFDAFMAFLDRNVTKVDSENPSILEILKAANVTDNV